jgi:hypothetical protein
MLVLTDNEAMFSLYGAWKLQKFVKTETVGMLCLSRLELSGRKVIRHDNSVKTDENVVTSQSTKVSTEKVGGYRLSQKSGVFHKAQKKLINRWENRVFQKRSGCSECDNFRGKETSEQIEEN